MRFQVALALIVIGVAYCQRPPLRLTYPEYLPGKTHLYDVTINMTAGVPGMSSQSSKAVVKAELKIYAKSRNEIILQMHKVRVSNSLPEVGSWTDDVPLESNRQLEESLKIPVKAIFEEGTVKSYTLSRRETLESQKIKRSILRNLEIYLDSLTEGGVERSWPVTYNLTRSSPAGDYESHYVATSSPFPDFPKEQKVFNISRTDNFEVLPYLAYKTHHNFAKQGCPEVCKWEHVENRFGAGCPVQHEPYHTPLKRSFVQHHNLRVLQNSVLIIDSVRTNEQHVVNAYDQDMLIDFSSFMQFTKTTPEVIPEPTDAQVRTDLDDLSQEVNEKEIEQLCQFPDTTAVVEQIKRLLNQIAESVLKEEIRDEKARKMGEMLVTVQKSLHTLKQAELRTLMSEIVNYDELERASETEKIKRQVLLDLLPLIGTPESVSFLVHLIAENMNLSHKYLSLWESKTILENLPQNIHRPTEKTIKELSSLLELLKDTRTPGYHIYYSAAHLAVARVIRSMCSNTTLLPESSSESSSSRYIPKSFRGSQLQENDPYKLNMVRTCPRTAARKFVEQIRRQLEVTEDRTKRVIYIETLARTGLEEALPIVKQYIYGQPTVRSSKPLSQSYVDYLKTVAIYSLHSMVEQHQRPIQDILMPVFLNKTEPPKVRTAAFGVIIKSQPTLGLLQQIAEQSWVETSQEVASHVRSTFETFGNSSMPCQQLTALRIKKVLPQMKYVDYGKQASKNVLYDLWDEFRGFGLEKRCSFVPSNESFIPSALYGSLGYNTDVLKDYLVKYALNVQGLTSRNVYDALLKNLGLRPADYIPKETEREIFDDLNIVSRDPEPWRLTMYESLFYTSSFYYFDAEENTHQDVIKMLVDQLKHYITRDSQGSYSGHLVKVYIPSSYHAKSVGLSLAYPVEFQLTNPTLVALKLKVQKTNEQQSGVGFEASLTPSVYHSVIYTHEVLNLGDCKKVGVHHRLSTAMTYPVVLTVNIESTGNFSFSYKFPDMPKNVLSYRSAAGTHTGKNYLEQLPPKENRRKIKTLPSQFRKPISLGVVGLPRFEGEIRSEDIQLGMEDTPRNIEEATWLVVRHFLNAGWRRKSVDITRVSDSNLWLPTSEVTVYVNHTRNFTSHKSSESDWSSDLKFSENLNRDEDMHVYATEGQKIYRKLSTQLSHIKDVIRVRVEQRERSRLVNKADLNLEYSHTLGGFLHFVHLNASAAFPKVFNPINVTADYAIAFTQRPNEFKYSQHQHEKQRALLIGSLSFSNSTPFSNASFIAKALLRNKPLDQVLDMDRSLSSKEFQPETHEECLKDEREGKTLSPACVKAIREKSIYNNMQLNAVWRQDLPRYVKETVEKVDRYLKHIFFSHMKVSRHEETSKRRVYVEATYIDKMTDEPVVDILVEKPTETLKLSKIDTGILRPLSSVETLKETLTASLTNNTYPATCTMGDKYVSTYDLMTYPLPRDTKQCSYVLTAHCTEQKKFAVIVKYSPETPGTQNIHVYLGRHKIVLVPGSRSSYKVKIDGREELITPSAPRMLQNSRRISASVHSANDGSSFVEIHARIAGLKIRYDGVRVKVQVHPRYKGELCGMCSEFNGELVREFRGVDRCLYTNAFDFAKSSAIGKCVDRTPKHNFMCNNDQVSYSWGKPQEQESEEWQQPQGQWQQPQGQWQQPQGEWQQPQGQWQQPQGQWQQPQGQWQQPQGEWQQPQGQWQQPQGQWPQQQGQQPSIKRNIVMSQGSKLCFSTKAVPMCQDNAQPTQTESWDMDFHCLPKSDMNARKLVTESKRRILGELETKKVDHSEAVAVAQQC